MRNLMNVSMLAVIWVGVLTTTGLIARIAWDLFKFGWELMP